MPSLVCTTAFQLEQLAQIMDGQEPRYNAVVPVTPSVDPAYIRLFQSYALDELHGAVDYYLYLDPYGKLAQSIPIFTVMAALVDKMIADAFQYEYTVQSINTVEVLLGYRINVIAGNLQGNINTETLEREGQIAQTAANLQGGINAEAAQRKAQIAQTAANLQGGINAEAAQREAQIGQTAAALQGNINAEAAQRQTQISETAANLQGNINTISSALTAVIGANVTALQANINTVAEQAIQEVHNAVVDAEAFATGLATAAVPAAVAKAVAVLQPQLDAIKTETTECLAPLCDTVTPNARQLGNLGKLLSGATDALLLGGLLALLAEAAHDPRAAASEIDTVLGDIVHGAATAARDLIGV